VHDHDCDDVPTAEDAARHLLRLYDQAGRLSLEGAAEALADECDGRFVTTSLIDPVPVPAVFAAFARLVVYVPGEQLFRPSFTFKT
jgi:hypothetical protein